MAPWRAPLEPAWVGKKVSERQVLLAFGTALRARRNALGISQEELAFRSGVHRTFVSELERGVKNPSLTTIARLALALGSTRWAIVKAAEDAE